MTSNRFVRILRQHLDRFQATAQLLADAQELGRPVTDVNAIWQQDLTAYAWAVRSRALLLMTSNTNSLKLADNTEVHIRLSVIETLLASRLGRSLTPQAEDIEQLPTTPAIAQRLATAESRLFHLFGIIPLN